MEYHYKVLGENQESFHGGSGRWRKRQWRSVQGEIIACKRGIHYCNRSQLVRWLGPTIWLFEDGSPDETVNAGDKMVTRKGRIVERVETWNETTARLFAADVAEVALTFIPETNRESFVAAINAARGYARGEIDEAACSAAESAARSAAWSAARSAARSAAAAAAAAAESAAWSAAWSAAAAAAESVAWSAAESAARSAARSAAAAAAESVAWSAADSAAESAQTEILFDYLEGRRS